MEIWKDIEGHPNYQVSNTGKIKSFCKRGRGASKGKQLIGKELIPRITTSGYYDVKLDGKRTGVHIFVARAFVPQKDGCYQVNHIDENVLNNNADNLEWCTQKQNNSHGTRMQRIARSVGCPVMSVNVNSGLILRFYTITDAMKTFSMGSKSILDSCTTGEPFKGRIWFREREQKRPVERINEDKEVIKKYPTIEAASADTGIKYNAIWRTCQEQTQRAGGIRWRYA